MQVIVSYYREAISTSIYFEKNGKHSVTICDGGDLTKECKTFILRSVLERLNKYCGFD